MPKAGMMRLKMPPPGLPVQPSTNQTSRVKDKKSAAKKPTGGKASAPTAPAAIAITARLLPPASITLPARRSMPSPFNAHPEKPNPGMAAQRNFPLDST
ncbi:hypothetical protein D3C71_1684090 [compost metagenome]